MKKFILPLIAFYIASFPAFSQREDIKRFNFGFEEVQGGYPIGWYGYTDHNYFISIDSLSSHSGRYSLAMQYYGDGVPEGKVMVFPLPENYDGQHITVSCYIKTESVTEGHAGLYVNIFPGVAYEGMNDRGITGTTDWTRYETTLPLDPARTKAIHIGGLLSGKGKMWMDDFMVLIDGEEIYERILLPADNDKEFDLGSGIIIPSPTKIDDLELMGKIWGFLKYNHPAIGRGAYNWDYELFRILPRYLQVKNKKARDELLVNWIDELGELNIRAESSSNGEIFLSPDMSWIATGDFSKNLKNRIYHIYENRHQGDHYYIRHHTNIGNPDFINENSYTEMYYPDAGFRLLSLYRYWNIIQYFFPYRYLTDKDWNGVLKEYIPIFLSAKDQKEYHIAVLRLIGEVNDSHANLWTEKIQELIGSKAPPFKVSFVEDNLVIRDYYNPQLADTTVFKIGSIITHINDKDIISIIDSLRPFYPASNDVIRLSGISNYILWSDNETITIDHLYCNEQKRTELSLYEPYKLRITNNTAKNNESDPYYKCLEGNIGYITLAGIRESDIPTIKETFIDAKGIIVDIRNYPNAFVPYSLGSYFVSKPTPFVAFTRSNVNNPGEFRMTPGDLILPDKYGYKGKLIVLVDENTMSQSEFTAMAFMAGDDTTVVGSTTAGADGDISLITLPGGLNTYITGIGIYFPDGRETQRVGIISDVEIRPTLKGIVEGRDEVLEKAIEMINQTAD